jgi:hypothetical protein
MISGFHGGPLLMWILFLIRAFDTVSRITHVAATLCKYILETPEFILGPVM